MDSEYNALSMSMRDVLPLHQLTIALEQALGLPGIGLPEFRSAISTKIEESNEILNSPT
jgi:hypothetical protein